MKLTLTAIYQEDPEGGFIGFIEEIPGINTQGETEEDVKKNLLDALTLSMDYHREETEKLLKGKTKGVHRHKYTLVSA